jgi:hypothetical protein
MLRNPERSECFSVAAALSVLYFFMIGFNARGTFTELYGTQISNDIMSSAGFWIGDGLVSMLVSVIVAGSIYRGKK